MKRLRRIVTLCAALYAAVAAEGQSLWMTLRPYDTKIMEVADTILPGGDTLFLRIEQPDTTKLKDLLNEEEFRERRINKAGFMLNYRPIDAQFTFESQYTPKARRDTFLMRTKSLGVDYNFADPAGLDPIDRARMDIIFAHPELMRYTWNEIPDLLKDIREGRLLDSKENDNERLSKIFKPDVAFIVDELKAKKVEEVNPWTLSGVENLQFSQLYVNNWIKGGENSASLLHDFRWKALFVKDRSQWETNVTSKLGLTYTSTLKGRVSDDLLDINSKYGFNAVNKWYYSFLFSFKTQLFRNYSSSDIEKESPKSTLLSPAYLQFIFGMDYKRGDDLSVLLSPYTGIITVVADTADIDPTNFGIDEGKRADFINGFSITVNWKKTIMYGVYYITRVELFYEYFRKNGNKRFDWENVFEFQINRFISTRLNLELRYFDNESEKFQVKENFSISFKYSF
ncbi:MAG: DUF3078 domain-containing protein [Bacteroidales bacterium]|nr:DUF3078 domain-containing protein [Bacteroidales bacterium]MDY4175228.1 DUF3078 domain-containing protein [Bacteroidales bacterium]